VLLSSLGIRTAIAGERKMMLEEKSEGGVPGIVFSDARANTRPVNYEEGLDSEWPTIGTVDIAYPLGHPEGLPIRMFDRGDRLVHRGQRLKLENALNYWRSQLEKSSCVFYNRFAGPMTELQKEIISASNNIANFKELVKPGDDVTTPYGEYTLLMQVASLKAAKYLVNECRADINEAVWQAQWGHYVTALDVFQWGFNNTKNPVYKANLKAILSFLNGKQAKSAGELGFWSHYFGDYVVSSQLPAIQDALNPKKKTSEKCKALIDNYKRVEDQLLGYYEPAIVMPRREFPKEDPITQKFVDSLISEELEAPMNTTYYQERERSYLKGLKAEDR